MLRLPSLGARNVETVTPAEHMPSDEVDRNRAENWDVLALLLSGAPSDQTLGLLAEVAGDETALGRAWRGLAQAAGDTDAASAAREFFDLFIGVGRGELLPYASFYITGFLNERPLAELRGDLARLGIARQSGDHDPEDRIALLCAIMAAYARGDLGHGPGPSQGEFFARHLAPWAAAFFEDLANAPAARFYAALARVGREFIAIETQGFALAAQERAIA